MIRDATALGLSVIFIVIFFDSVHAISKLGHLASSEAMCFEYLFETIMMPLALTLFIGLRVNKKQEGILFMRY